jgi:hypothetical protein
LAVTRIPIRFRESVSRRFWANTKPTSDGCVVWLGEVHHIGYGKAYGWYLNGKEVRLRAHRLAWMLEYGRIPNKLLVCHTCDNPLCVKPSHLFIGTDKDNNDDKGQKGRSKGNTMGGGRLTMRQVVSMRKEYSEGVSYGALARKYGVARWSVSRLIRRKLRP